MKPDNRENLDLSNLENEKMDKRKIGFGFWVSIGWMVLVIMAAFLAPILPIPDPDQTGVGGRLDAPNWDNWFGTDTVSYTHLPLPTKA